MVTNMSNLPVTSATSRTSGILNNSFKTLSLIFESISRPVRALTLKTTTSSLILRNNYFMKPIFRSLLILLYTTEELTLIDLESFGTEILASLESSLSILKSRSSILPIRSWISLHGEGLINVLFSKYGVVF